MRILLFAMPNVMVGLDQSGKFPILGLASLAGNVENCEVKIANLVLVRSKIKEYVIRLIKEYKPHLVGCSCMSFQYDTALAIAKIVKEIDPYIKVCFGGYHPTLLYQEIIESPDSRHIDFIIRSEGEATFRALVEALRNGQSFAGIRGLSFKERERFCHNPPRDLLDLSEIKLPDRKARLLTDFKILGCRSDVIETSRGCTYPCKFCSIRQFYGRNYRTYSIQRVIEDIRDAYAHGAELIFMVDDNITLNVARFEEICDAIVGNRLNNLHYMVQASVGGIAKNERLVDKMARAGFKGVFLGLENVSQRNLIFMDKDKHTVEQAETAVAYLRKNKILTLGGLILGQPEDNEEDFWANYSFAKRLKLDGPIFFVCTPYPKTKLREELQRAGLITNATDYTWYDGSKANVRTHHLSTEEIDRLVMKMYSQYFDYEYFKFTNLWRLFPWFFFQRLLKEVLRLAQYRTFKLFRSGRDKELKYAHIRDQARREKWLLE